MENEIYFGLDLGTSNIGYAVTDQDYNVLKVSGKRALGVRVFSEANTAVDRRTQRSARRRLQRRKQRINLLQDLFNDEMNKVDCNFFRKLNENDRILDDKSYKTKYSLFNDDNYTDVEYYKQYPTIYHLRQEQLIKGETDIRKLYLSIHHIIKYRGHFLLDGDMQNSVGDIDNLLDYFNDINFNISQYNSELEVSEQNPLCDEYIVNKENIIKLKDIYQNDKQNKIEKKKTITALLQAKDKVAQSFIDSLFNSNIDIANFFGKGKYESEDFSTSKFTFSSGAYDEIILELEDKLNEYEINILKGLKSIYDYLVLSKLLKNEKYLSNAMVNIYNKHNQDLILLKALFKGHKNEYEEVFGESKEGKIDNYSKYVGGQKNKKKGKIYEKITDTELFYKFLKKELIKIKNKDNEKVIQYIEKEMDNGAFLPKIVTKNNSKIAYQLNKIELEHILNNASINFPFLNNISDNMTIKDKIISLLEFRIPYYAGTNIGVKRDDKDYSKITPWNFEEKIDLTKSNENFINSMLAHCTYLKNEMTMAKNSILYSAYMVLNTINKIKIGGEEIS